MSADDQIFLDVLASVSKRIQQSLDDCADMLDVAVEKVASNVRDTLASAPWIPDSIRPARPPVYVPVSARPVTRMEKLQDWVAQHKVLTGIMIIAAGTISYRMYRSNQSRKKSRKARKSKRNGGRMDVVVIAGSPALPLTRSLALDMERKGFIVFIICNSMEDDNMVHHLSRPDIRPLSIDVTDPPSANAAVDRFAMFLKTPHVPVPMAKPDNLSLKAVLLIPALNYQTSPIATIPPGRFSDVFNTHLLHPIVTIQTFLPLLTARLSPVGEKWKPPKVLVFTPSIISSINPPFHAPEATVCSALTAFTDVLTAELRPLSIPVTHMQLGTFDFSGFTPARRQLVAGIESAVTNWPESAQVAYGRNYAAQTESAVSGGRIRGMKGSSLRRLHASVFDVIDGSITSDSVRIGLGASVYGLVGRWAPRSLVTWMMGIRKVDELSTWQQSASGEASQVGSDNEGSQDFVAVPEGSDVANIWRES